MVISKLNIVRIQNDLNLIGDYLSKLEKFSEISLEEFLSDVRNPASCESFLRRCIDAMFDIGRHVLSKGFGYKPLEYKDIARVLAEKGIISKEYSETLVKIAGYRNRMVHFYKEITDEELYNIVKNNLGDIKHFIKEITEFLEEYKKQERNENI